jgi:4-amino-4-deoxy-L-arabinose transferase-like glycosyltransferase
MMIPSSIRRHTSVALLALIVFVSAVMHFGKTDTLGLGNPYYTAAVDNMLRSPSNMFFATADYGAVTVDKPPIALWVQAFFVALLGMNGLAVVLPSILAGLVSIVVLYHLIARQFGQHAGLIAALVMAFTPINVAVNQTNNLDSLLICCLLLATWAYIRATETSLWRHLLLGAFLLGIAFNIKMLQAYLIIPALYGLYFLGASITWKRKFVQLAVSSVVLLVVSFSWVLVVDAIDAESRPYIGGTQVNSTIDLVFGYNGIARVMGVNAIHRGSTVTPTTPLPPQNSSTPVITDVGNPGVMRLFEPVLANEFAWLLPVALISLALIAWQMARSGFHSSEGHAVLLWGGWLIVGMVYFSYSVFFHAYYLATLTPSLAALIGIGLTRIWQLSFEQRKLAMVIIGGTLLITLAIQWMIMGYYDVSISTFAIPLSLCISVIIVGLYNVWVSQSVERWEIVVRVAYLSAIMMIPIYWTVASVWQGVNQVLPAAFDNRGISDPAHRVGIPSLDFTKGDLNILDIVQVNPDVRYDLVATSAVMAAPIVINSDVRVLYLGGFNGNDPIYDLPSFAAMIEDGDIGFVLTSDHNQQALLNEYASSICPLARIVIEPRELPMEDGRFVTRGGALLYDCTPKD